MWRKWVRGVSGAHKRRIENKGDARLLPALVVDVVVGTHDTGLGRALVPGLCFEDLGLVDERSVVAEHPLVGREGLCGHRG